MSEEKARVVLEILSDRFESLFSEQAASLSWWQNLIAFTSSELVSTSVGHHFSLHRECLNDVPSDFIEYFTATHSLNTSRNKGIYSQILELSESLNDIGIVPTLLKGSSCLVRNTYPSVGFRVQGDIDLLVDDSQFVATVNQIKSKGYSVRSSVKEEYFLSCNHLGLPSYPELVRSESEATIDVHRVPAFCLKTGEQFRVDSKARLRTFNVERAAVTLFNPLDEFIHSLYHSQVQDMGHASGSVKIRYLVDLINLHRLAVSAYDDNSVLNHLTRYGLLNEWRQVSKLIDYLSSPNAHKPPVRCRLALMYPGGAQYFSQFLRRSRVATRSPERYVNPLFWKNVVHAYKN